MANRFTPPEKLLPARAKRSLVIPIRWTPEERKFIEDVAEDGEKLADTIRRRTLVGFKAVVIGLLLLAAGCVTDESFRAQAMRSAASEHGCADVTIKRIVAESRMQSEFAYWLNVCGSERLYRLDTVTGGRFVDQTQSVR